MLKRRTFLQLAAGLPLLLSGARLRAETEFERYQREQRQGAAAMGTEWQRYQSDYQAAFRQYQQQLSRVWNEPELSGQKVWVEYSDNLQTRRSIDFDRNEVRLSFTATDAARLTDERIRAEFERVMNTTLQQAYQRDPVLRQSAGQQAPASRQPVTGSSQTQLQALLQQASRQQQHTGKGTVITVTIPLPASAVPERAQHYWPLVQKQAQKWAIDPALVLAIMQTESAFNPLARSHVPAFGLMQIVPSSAGRDATRLAWGRETLLSGAQLFQPETNIELGCAYLHLLNTRYLAAVRDPRSRLYCVIAAYNTGAGNVARAFTGTTSVKEAAVHINRLSAAQVFRHLQQRLPHTETRRYLAKVTTALSDYQA